LEHAEAQTRGTAALLLCSFFLSVSATSALAQTAQTVRSPDGRLALNVSLGERISYDVLSDDKTLLKGATLSITIDGVTLGRAPRLVKATPRSEDATVEPPVRQKAAAIRDRYNELRLDMHGGYAVTFRAYDEGVAYRFETALGATDVKVIAEEAAFNFTENHTVYYPEEESFFSHNERHFLPRALGDLAPKNIASLPAVVDASGIKVAIAESDVEAYPGLWLRGTGGNGLAALFPPYPLEEKLERDRDLRVVKSADYIAKTTGTRSYPWRIVGVARRDAELITNPLVYLLAKPSQVADTSWIRPGKVAWDWWNANNISGVDFKAGVNTATYKHYIDFASKHGLEYVILDEGWYRLGNVLDVVPEIDMAELTTYAKQRNVGLILWVIWKTFDDQLQAALDRFEKWGIRGIKVDFMQRDDQPVVDFYHRVSREAAKRRMLVDFHGAIRPALMTRTWPNLMTAEGVRGLEWCKWSAHTHPEHDATLPFTRMFLGPMDYTPGAMVNAPKQSFVDVFERPMSQGTRAHQLALYAIFESPLQMLADSPSNYAREPEAMEWLARVPVVWDETRVLQARIGDYVVVARRSGSDWYIGAITDWERRELEIDLSFLPAGSFQMEAYQDGVNAGRRGEDCKKVTSSVTSGTKLKISLAEGGGWAARIAGVR
jgi:alpha-glucosidase